MRERAEPAECAAVVKANAYGTGSARVVPALAAAGCGTFFVALPEEGAEVRAAAPEAAIYVLDGFLPGLGDSYRRYALRPVLGSPEEIAEFARWRSGERSALHVDTGMNRLGLRMEELTALSRDDLERAGTGLLMSHLACADEPEHALNERQRERFASMRERFPDLPASFANSAGVFLGDSYLHDLARPGIALYGGASHPDARMEPVVTAEALIVQVREARRGETVGYGAAETLTRDSRIAIAAAGYADGYLRAEGIRDGHDGGEVSVAGARTPLLGRVSMDLIAIDVTDLPNVERGGRVELFGPEMLIDDVAERGGTIAYELLTGLSRRAERVYVGGADG